MRMQLQIWFAGLNMGVEMKTRAQRIRKRSAKAKVTPAVTRNRPQRVA